MLNQKNIVVVMPAYNAATTLEQTYLEIPHDIVDDVILVDDQSHDDTASVTRESGIKNIIVHERNTSYGGNQKSCYRAALELGADFDIGEITCPTRYEEGSSSMSFAAPLRYGLGVVKSFVQFRFHRWGIYKSDIFSQLDEAAR